MIACDADVSFSQGITVSGISFPGKTVTLKGLNNLKNGVTIKSFDLPGNEPAGGIHLTLDTTITNVSLNWLSPAILFTYMLDSLHKLASLLAASVSKLTLGTRILVRSHRPVQSSWRRCPRRR